MTATDPTYAALLAGVLATPEDDVPRLVLADWLEENGEPERAEFVRVQVELANIPDPPPEPSVGMRSASREQRLEALKEWKKKWVVRYYVLRRRERELFQFHGRAWSFMPDEFENRCCSIEGRDPPAVLFRRGFVESVSCDLATFMGGPCENCGGFGEFRRRHDNGDGPEGPCPDCGGKWNSGPHDDPNDYWDRGTGRTPGIAPRLFASQPVTRVTLTDCDPTYPRLPRDIGWHRADWWRPGMERDRDYLPADVWDSTAAVGGRREVTQGGIAWLWFDSEPAALDALSAALVAYGRANAEGMTHEAVCDLCGVHEWKQRHPGIDPGGLTAWCRCEGTGTVRKPGLPPLADTTRERTT